ncbi:tRNA adenosine(34) deaminase TadA [Eubacteriaceae bacterium ES3]|nr:tRNA adenosine(34) deaminase TadA [Eubacteriaceae bacterium ES3]
MVKLQDYMKLAIEMAKKGFEQGEVPIGAVFVWDGKVIAKAHNLTESLNDPTAHAEMIVIREAAKKLGTWRLKRGKLFVTAEPCYMCTGAIIQARIPVLVFGINEWKTGGVESTFKISRHPNFNKGMQIYGGILDEDCKALMQTFFKNRRLDSQ